MRKVFGLIIVAVGILSAPSAMAVHKCGQLMGSCIPHLSPTPIIKPRPPISVEPARPVIIRPAVPVQRSLQCFRKSRQGNYNYLISIPCGSGGCFRETNGYLLLISCTRR